MISIVGSGRVGASIAFLCVSNGLDDVLLLNRNKKKALGEALDIASAIPANSKFSINGTDDYSELSDLAWYSKADEYLEINIHVKCLALF